jgi:hypothetical protein
MKNRSKNISELRVGKLSDDNASIDSKIDNKWRLWMGMICIMAGSIFLGAVPAFAQTPCSELFITEVTVGKNEISQLSGSTFELNYAIEVFNPTGSDIELSGYALELTDGVTPNIIPLNGVIAAGQTYVICNSSAGYDLKQFANQLSERLDFEPCVTLALKRGNVVIDKIGQGGTPTAGTFDPVAFVNDPYGYLATYHLDFNDFQSIDMRRSLLTEFGDPVMNSPSEIIGEWAYFPNSDVSDLGNYVGLCNRPAANDIVGFNTASGTVSVNNTLQPDPLTLKMNGSTSYYPNNTNASMSYSQEAGSTGNVCSDMSINPFPEFSWFPLGSAVNSSQFPCSTNNFKLLNNGSNPGVSSQGNFSNASCKVIIKMSSNNSNVTIDAAKSNHVVYRVRSAGIEETKSNTIKLSPNPATSIINVSITEPSVATVIDNLGRQIYATELTPLNNVIGISTLTPGVYTLIINGKSKQASVIFEKIR